MPFQLREADSWKICTKWTNQTPRAGQYTGDRRGMKRCLMIYYTWYVFILPCGQVDNSISILLNWSYNTRDSVEPRPRHMIGMFASLNSVMCRCIDLYVHNIYIYMYIYIYMFPSRSFWGEIRLCHQKLTELPAQIIGFCANKRE